MIVASFMGHPLQRPRGRGSPEPAGRRKSGSTKGPKSSTDRSPATICGGESRAQLLGDVGRSLFGEAGMGVRIAIASDHAALELKAALAAHLREAGHDVIDLG